MTTLIILLGMLAGPPVEQNKSKIYILVDSKSIKKEHAEIVRKSKIIKQELSKYEEFFPTELFYINNYWDVIVEEYEDKRFEENPIIPSFKFNKNQSYQEFCPGTFQASGSFILSLNSLVRWEKYIPKIVTYNPYENQSGDSEYSEVTVLQVKRRGLDLITHKSQPNYYYWRHQPPSHPPIYPRFPDKSTAYYFYNYEPRFVTNKPEKFSAAFGMSLVDLAKMNLVIPEQLPIDDEDIAGQVFWREYADENFWFAGID